MQQRTGTDAKTHFVLILVGVSAIECLRDLVDPSVKQRSLLGQTCVARATAAILSKSDAKYRKILALPPRTPHPRCNAMRADL